MTFNNFLVFFNVLYIIPKAYSGVTDDFTTIEVFHKFTTYRLVQNYCCSGKKTFFFRSMEIHVCMCPTILFGRLKIGTYAFKEDVISKKFWAQAFSNPNLINFFEKNREKFKIVQHLFISLLHT